jgi:glutamyl-tRNA synthetase
MAVQVLDLTAFWDWLGQAVENLVPLSQRDLFANAVKSNIAFREDAIMWANIFYSPSFEIEDVALSSLQEAGKSFFVEALNAVDQHGAALDVVLAQMKVNLGLSGKKLFMPLRVALTGKLHGPELANIALLLGKDKIKERLHWAMTYDAKNI